MFAKYAKFFITTEYAEAGFARHGKRATKCASRSMTAGSSLTISLRVRATTKAVVVTNCAYAQLKCFGMLTAKCYALPPQTSTLYPSGFYHIRQTRNGSPSRHKNAAVGSYTKSRTTNQNISKKSQPTECGLRVRSKIL